jgi:hypothetical protein
MTMNTHKKIIEQVTITGKKEEYPKAYAYIEKHGFRVTRSGPMKISVAKYDTSRFKIVAEREVKND